MRVLNEKVARMANIEDDVTGRFWEGRFKCQALLDDQALLSCLAYIDLNPVRAGIADTPEQSDHTSIRHRIKYWQQNAGRKQTRNTQTDTVDGNDQLFQSDDLHPFVGHLRQPMPKGIGFNLIDYLQLVDWTGRQIREDKIGAVSAQAEPILTRLSISPEHWVYLCRHFESRFKGLVGCVHSLEEACQVFGRKRRPNLAVSTALYP